MERLRFLPYGTDLDSDKDVNSAQIEAQAKKTSWEEFMTTASTTVRSEPLASNATRWGQLIFGIICMVMIANLQYGWTLFVNPIDQKYHCLRS